MPDIDNELPTSDELHAPLDDSIKGADKKKRTTVNVSVYGDDAEWIEAEAERTGVSRAKILIEYAREYAKLRDEMIGASANGYEGSFLHAQIAGLEARLSVSMHQMQTQQTVLTLAISLVHAQLDAKIKADLAQVPSLSKEHKEQALAAAPGRYENIIKAIISGVTDDGGSVLLEKIITEIDNRSAGDE